MSNNNKIICPSKLNFLPEINTKIKELENKILQFNIELNKLKDLVKLIQINEDNITFNKSISGNSDDISFSNGLKFISKSNENNEKYLIIKEPGIDTSSSPNVDHIKDIKVKFGTDINKIDNFVNINKKDEIPSIELKNNIFEYYNVDGNIGTCIYTNNKSLQTNQSLILDINKTESKINIGKINSSQVFLNGDKIFLSSSSLLELNIQNKIANIFIDEDKFRYHPIYNDGVVYGNSKDIQISNGLRFLYKVIDNEKYLIIREPGINTYNNDSDEDTDIRIKFGSILI